MTELLIACVLVVCTSSYLVNERIIRVCDFRCAVLERICDLAVSDFDSGHDQLALSRLEAFDTVSMSRMVVQVWKPLRPESFWNDTSFLEQAT
jgi:hypothetical protein